MLILLLIQMLLIFFPSEVVVFVYSATKSCEVIRCAKLCQSHVFADEVRGHLIFG